MSRSVAVTRNVPAASASIKTLERMGMVLRRSTTDCTWLRQRSRVARSMVAFIVIPYPYISGAYANGGPESAHHPQVLGNLPNAAARMGKREGDWGGVSWG